MCSFTGKFWLWSPFLVGWGTKSKKIDFFNFVEPFSGRTKNVESRARCRRCFCSQAYSCAICVGTSPQRRDYSTYSGYGDKEIGSSFGQTPWSRRVSHEYQHRKEVDRSEEPERPPIFSSLVLLSKSLDQRPKF